MQSFNKTQTTVLIFVLGTFWCFTSGTVLNPNNPPIAQTGAPGESTCSTTPGCHSGGSFTGTIQLSGLPDTVQPDQTYALTLTHMSNAVRAGFQMTALDTSHLRSGTLTAGSGSNIANAFSGRQYIRHSTFRTLNMGTTAWTFSWRAPAAAAGNTISFYMATLAANGNNNRTGDNALTNAKTVVLADNSTSSQAPEALPGLQIYPNPVSSEVRLDLPVPARLTVFDLRGRIMLEQEVDGQSRFDVQHWPAGPYLFRVVAGERESVRKIWKY